MKRMFTFVIIVMTLTACTALQPQGTPESIPTDMPQAGMPNPASVYCTQQGNTHEIRTVRLIAFCFFLIPGICLSHEDLLKELQQSEVKETEYISSTFKGSRLINGQTIETRYKGELEFIFAHRFGPMNGGLYELYGLDQAYVRIGLEYGLTDRLGVGIGRNSVDKTVDGFLRYKALRQSKAGMPISVTAFGIMAVKTSPKDEDAGYDITFQDRTCYTAQLLIARKFTPATFISATSPLYAKWQE